MVDFKRIGGVFAALAMSATVVAATAGPAGAQTITCGGEVATIVGTPGDETIIGTPGDDVIAALQGDDIVKGAGGNDIICGGIGDDQLFGGDGFDIIFGAQGNDLLISAKTKTGPDTAGSRMFGGAGNDEVHGSTGWDRMQGGPGNDELYGYASRDWLRGGPGNDIVDGGAWIDDMNGGLGRDQVFVEGADFARGGAGTQDTCVMVGGFGEATTAGCSRVFPTAGEPSAPAPQRPDGTLGNITMARADWQSGYVQAEILHNVLEEVGYNVSSPADFEVGPQLAYSQMAEGNIDLWANSWYPGHYTWWEQDTPIGTVVGDNLVRLEDSLFDAPQGWIITKSWAEENNITTMDDINRNPELAGQLPDTDGDGVGEVFTCQESWTCDDIQRNQFEFAGWDNLQPLVAGYDAMFAEFEDRVAAGLPAVMYTWTPAEYVTRTVPGVDVMWLSVENDSVLDDSNPLGLEGGANHCQRCNFELGDGIFTNSGVIDAFGTIGFDDLGADVCLQGPDGCQLGWQHAEINVTANQDWLAANPIAEELLNLFRPDVIDISILQVEHSAGDGSQADVNRIAADWITANRELVDSWVAQALAAG